MDGTKDNTKIIEAIKMTDTTIIYTLVYQVFDCNINRYLTVKEVTKAITEEVYNNITMKFYLLSY